MAGLQLITVETPVFKKLKYLFIHCTGSAEGKETTGKDLIAFFKAPEPKGRGWTKPGYVDIIHLNGDIENLVPYDDNAYMEPREITNGVAGMNSISRSFAYIGGVAKDGKTPKDTRTVQQKEVMLAYIMQKIAVWPDILVCGHNQFAPKACPSFDTVKWLREMGVPEKNIYKKA